jgi:hypothetical protein
MDKVKSEFSYSKLSLDAWLLRLYKGHEKILQRIHRELVHKLYFAIFGFPEHSYHGHGWSLPGQLGRHTL